MKSRFGSQAGEIRTSPGANKFRPNPARPLVAYFIMNLVVASLLTWGVFAYGPEASARMQGKPVEVIIKSTAGTPTEDITAAIHALNRRDVEVQSFAELTKGMPSGLWPTLAVLVIATFFATGPFFFVYCVAYWIVSKFD